MESVFLMGHMGQCHFQFGLGGNVDRQFGGSLANVRLNSQCHLLAKLLLRDGDSVTCCVMEIAHHPAIIFHAVSILFQITRCILTKYHPHRFFFIIDAQVEVVGVGIDLQLRKVTQSRTRPQPTTVFKANLHVNIWLIMHIIICDGIIHIRDLQSHFGTVLQCACEPAHEVFRVQNQSAAIVDLYFRWSARRLETRHRLHFLEVHLIRLRQGVCYAIFCSFHPRKDSAVSWNMAPQPGRRIIFSDIGDFFRPQLCISVVRPDDIQRAAHRLAKLDHAGFCAGGLPFGGYELVELHIHGHRIAFKIAGCARTIGSHSHGHFVGARLQLAFQCNGQIIEQVLAVRRIDLRFQSAFNDLAQLLFDFILVETGRNPDDVILQFVGTQQHELLHLHGHRFICRYCGQRFAGLSEPCAVNAAC